MERVEQASSPTGMMTTRSGLVSLVDSTVAVEARVGGLRGLGSDSREEEVSWLVLPK